MPEVTVYMFKPRGVPEMLQKMMVKLTNELRKLAGEEEHSPEPSATSTEPDCVHPAGQGALRSRSAQAELARRTRAKKNIQRFPSSHRGSPQLPSPARELESFTTNLIYRSQTTAPSAARAIERLRQEIAQRSIEDYVGRSQSVSVSQYCDVA